MRWGRTVAITMLVALTACGGYTEVHEVLLRTPSAPIPSVFPSTGGRSRSATRTMHSTSMGPALAWPEVVDLSGRELVVIAPGTSRRSATGAPSHVVAA